MQDAASWLFPSTEASQADPQSMPKSKQLVQRFNQAFRRNKGTTMVSSSDLVKSMSQPEIRAEGAEVPGSQGRAGGESRTGAGQHHGLQASRAEGRASKAGQVSTSSEGGPASEQKACMQGARAGDRADPGSSPGATPRQPLKLRTFPQQPYTSPLPAPSFPLQRTPSTSQSPFSQLRSSLQPLLRSSSASSAAQAEAQDRPNTTPKQAVPGRNVNSQYSPDPGFNIQPSPDQSSPSLESHSKSRALSTQRSAPAARAEGDSPATWSSTHILQAVPTPDREEEQKDRAARNPRLFNWPDAKSFEAVPEQQHVGYIPGMYDGFAATTSASGTIKPPPQQQQQVVFQSQEQQQWPQQQQQQLQQQLSRANSRDYMVDMQALNTVPQSCRQTPREAQRAQRELGRPSSSSGQGHPSVVQQVPFYQSSPEYMPTTLAIKTPRSSRVSSYFTGLLGSQKKPNDVEAGMRPGSNSSAPQEDPKPAGCSPKTALFRSGIFQNSRAADQDRPMSPEQAERRARGLVRTRVEPKVFFANERTFLQWLQISVLLMFTGLSLLGGSSVSSLGGSGEATTACDTTACKASKVGSSDLHACRQVYTIFHA